MLIEILFIIAFVLLVTEAFNPTKGILAISGFIAYVYGVWLLIDSGADNFYGVSVTNVIILGCVFAGAMVIFFIALNRAMAKKPDTGTEFLKGQTARVTHWANGKGKVFVDGEDWRAVGPDVLQPDDEVIIIGYNKLTLTVEKK